MALMNNNAEAIYSQIALYLQDLTDDAFVEIVLNLLDEADNEDDLTTFETITSQLEEHLTNILTCRTELTVFTEMDSVKSDILTLKLIYSQTQCPINVEDLLLLIDLAGYILNAIEDLNSDLVNINYSEFCALEDLSDSLSLRSHFYESTSDIVKSFAFFYGDSSLEVLQSGGLTPNLATLMMGLLSPKENICNKSFFIVKNSEDNLSQMQALALLKLFIVCSGKKFHEVKELPPRNMEHYIDNIQSELNYQQFNESLIILSEYNSRKEILNKYLSIYHMVENFMFKYPLVKLNRDKGGEMFSIRDFKNMYKKVDSTEPDSLETFLKVVLLEFNQAQFLQSTHSAFQSLTTTNLMTEDEINSVFTTLAIGNKNGYFTYTQVSANSFKQQFPTILSKLIYIIRNGIVHNKETEFHLSHETLDHNIFKFIETFLIPQIEDILFSLLIENNEIVWYEHQNIKLFA